MAQNFFAIFRHKSKRLLGLDIRQQSIRVVELSYTNRSYQLESCEYLALPADCTYGSAYKLEIKRALQQLSINTKNVAVAISYGSAIFQQFIVDKDLSLKDINKFLRFQLTRGLEVDNDRISFNYEVTEKEDMQQIQLVAALKDELMDYSNLVSGAGFLPTVIDLDIYAIERAIRFQLQNITGLVAIVNFPAACHGDKPMENYQGKEAQLSSLGESGIHASGEDKKLIKMLILVIDNYGIVYVKEDVVGKSCLDAVSNFKCCKSIIS